MGTGGNFQAEKNMIVYGNIDLHEELKIPASVTTLVIIYNFL